MSSVYTGDMFRSIAKLLKNPRVRQLLIWAAPIILGWLFDKSKNSSSKSKVATRKKTK